MPPVSTIQRAWFTAAKSKGICSTLGCCISLKSMATKLPTEEAIWSIKPQGFPKYTFSAYWPIWAIFTADCSLLQYKPFNIVPNNTSKAAEEESPEPFKTFEVIKALKPFML